MKEKLVVANLKMYFTAEAEMRSYAEKLIALEDQKKAGITYVVCPATLFVRECMSITEHGFVLGAQNIFWEQSGAFTSGVSPRTLKESGSTHAIIGHSERRTHMGETDDMVARRVNVALCSGITPIVCVGEDLMAREDDTYFDVVEEQVRSAVSALGTTSDPTQIVFAYEPVWAISDSRPADAPDVTTNDVMSMRLHIMKILTEVFDRETAESIRILYGGSVNPDNVEQLCIAPEMDGVLVGSAGKDPKVFLEIARAF